MELQDSTSEHPSKTNLIDACRLVVAQRSYVLVREKEIGVLKLVVERGEYDLSELDAFADDDLIRWRKEVPKSMQGYTLLDLFTAQHFTQVYDLLSPQNQAKTDSFPMLKQIDIMWKLVARCRR